MVIGESGCDVFLPYSVNCGVMGDRVVGLCNFCEVHGPRVVFVCQETSGATGLTRIGGGRLYGDVGLDLGTYGITGDDAVSVATSTESCDGCRAFNTSKPVFLTNDDTNRSSYVGCQYPYLLDLFSRVRGACVRSLSCEACPGRQGPILFGDTNGGYCLCYVFTLKDSKARGFQHSYSIVIVSHRIDELIGNYSSLVATLKTIVTTLQYWSDCVFEREGAESADRLPQIAASGRAGWVPSGFFLRAAGGGGTRRLAAPRSLMELTNRNDVFHVLQDMFVDLHRLAALSSPYGLLHIGDDSYQLYAQTESSTTDRASDGRNGDDDEQKNDKSHHICIGADMDSSSLLSFRTLLLLHDVLGSEAFSMLAYHLLIGNQVVVRASCVCLNRLFLDALKLLLPSGCIKCVHSSSGYRESWECNLVGVLVVNEPSDTAQNGDGRDCDDHSSRRLSESVQKLSPDDGCVILCVETSGPLNGKYHCPASLATRSLTKDHLKSLHGENYQFRMFCASAADSGRFFDIELPTLLQSVLHLLSTAFSRSYRTTESAHVVLGVLECLKEEWLRKAKLYHVMSKTHDGDDDRWRDTFFRMAKCTAADEPVLKFWRGGLDRRFKQSVLSYCALRYQTNQHH